MQKKQEEIAKIAKNICKKLYTSLLSVTLLLCKYRVKNI
jgi:hypothetical protein